MMDVENPPRMPGSGIKASDLVTVEPIDPGGLTIVQHGRLEFTIQCDVCGSKVVPFKDGGLDKMAMDAFKKEHRSCS